MADIMTAEYLTKLKAEMEGRLGCGIEVVEDRDSIYPCKMEYARNYARMADTISRPCPTATTSWEPRSSPTTM